MYMYYLLGHKLSLLQNDNEEKKIIAQNTFILALDGDVDFQPRAVQLLVDRMKKNVNVGAACGRILPIGMGNISFLYIEIFKNASTVPYIFYFKINRSLHALSKISMIKI